MFKGAEGVKSEEGCPNSGCYRSDVQYNNKFISNHTFINNQTTSNTYNINISGCLVVLNGDKANESFKTHSRNASWEQINGSYLPPPPSFKAESGENKSAFVDDFGTADQ